MSVRQRQGLLMAGLLTGGLMCLAAGPKPGTSNLSRLVGVTVQASESGGTLIEVVTTGPAPYHIFRMEHPKRLVLDLEDTELAARDRLYAGQGPLVERIRLGQRDDQGSPVVRVVADLKQDCGFDIRHTPNGVEEQIWSGAGPAPVAAATLPNAPPVPVASSHEADRPGALHLLNTPSVWNGLLPKLTTPAPAAGVTPAPVGDLRSPIPAAAVTSAPSTQPSSPSPISAFLSATLANPGPAAPPPAPLPEATKDAADVKSASVAPAVPPITSGDDRPVTLHLLNTPSVWNGLLPKLTTPAPAAGLKPAPVVDLRSPIPPPAAASAPSSEAPSRSPISDFLTATLTNPAPAAPAPPPAPLPKATKDAAEVKPASVAPAVPPVTSGNPHYQAASLPVPLREVASKSVQSATSIDLTSSVSLERASATPPPSPRPKPASAATVAPPPQSAPAQAVPPPASPPPSQAVAQPQVSLGPESCGGPPYTGERNSFNLKDVDLKDFFRLIHEVSGLNVIVDSNVSGAVTLALDNVPWDQALHFVLGNNGLVCTVEGNVLRIARAQTLSDEAKAAPLVTIIRYLHYATASDVNLNNIASTAGGGGVNPPPTMFGVATILKNMGDKVLGPGGTVSADPRDNAVVFSCLPKQVPIIEKVIDELDQRSRQISIEARIVLTTNDVVREIQTSVTNFLRNTSGTLTGAGTTGTGSSAQGVPPTTLPSLPSLPAITQTAPGGFGAYAIVNQTAKYFISAAIAAAENRNQAKTISAPTIVTQNNVPGTVSQGTQIPLQTVINNTVTTVYINATLTLGVTPVVSGEGSIFLNIIVQNNAPGPVIPGTNNPQINTQAATTQVLVPDGGAVVFGGIKITNETHSVNQVPFLGDVPILGHLFKSTNRETQENELLFVVTPKILG